jgi:hypothetical protein
MNNVQVSVVSDGADEDSRNLQVLRIASAAKNSVSQSFSARAQVSINSITDLHKKLIEKLRLHRISQVQTSVLVRYVDDRAFTFESMDDFVRSDFHTEMCTSVLTIKWSFIIDVDGGGSQHMHSVYLRISERPNPGLIFQKVFSKHNDDIDSFDNGMFAPISCKVDFLDGQFGGEILGLVQKWAASLPKAEPVFKILNWLWLNDDKIIQFVKGTLPAVATIAYVGVWLGLIKNEYTESIRIASAWILSGVAVYLLSQYIAELITNYFGKNIRRINNVPVFALTAGDNQKLTEYLSKSQRSIYGLIGGALCYGVFKAIGLYLATYVIRSLFGA